MKIYALIFYTLFIFRSKQIYGKEGYLREDITMPLTVFADFMRTNNLKQCLIIQNDAKKFNAKNLQIFSNEFRVRFFNANFQSGEQVEELFSYSTTRMAVLIIEMDSVTIREKVLQTASHNGYFTSTFVWLFVMNNISASAQILPEIKQVFNDLNINVNSDITLAVTENDMSYQLYDIYKICHACGLPLQIEAKGNWSAEEGLVLKPQFKESIINRRHNFQNITVKAVTVVREKPKNMTLMEFLEEDSQLKQLDSASRKGYHLFKLVASALNIRYDVSAVESFGIFNFTGNNTWDGVVGSLLYGNAEISITPLRIIPERLKAVSYTTELHKEFLGFIFRHPRGSSIRNIFLEPFDKIVWWCVFALIIFSILLLTLNLQLEHRKLVKERQQQQQQQDESSNRKNQINMHGIQDTEAGQPEQQKQRLQNELVLHSNSNLFIEYRLDFVILTISEAFFMQGPSPDAFTFVSTRLLIISICVFALLLLQFYSGFIVGSLLSTPPRSITTLEALSNSSFEVGMENISYNYEIFMKSTSAIVRDMYQRRMCANVKKYILGVEEGLQRVKQGGFAYHVSTDRAERILQAQLTDSEFCELQEIEAHEPFKSLSGTTKNSSYREHIAHIVLYLRETALMQHNNKVWEVKKTDCSLNSNTEVEVDLEHFIPALAMLAAVMAMSLFVLAMEIFINWWYNRSARILQKIKKFKN